MAVTKIKKETFRPSRLFFVYLICFILSLGIGCGGGGGGGGSDDDAGDEEITGDDTVPTVFTDHLGVWELVAFSKVQNGDAIETQDFPYIFGTLGIEFTGYAKVTDDSITLYVGIDKLPEDVDPGNGIFYCDDGAIMYTINGSDFETDDGRDIEFDVSGNSLTLTIDSGTADYDSLLYELSAVDSSYLDDAILNCEIYEYLDM